MPSYLVEFFAPRGEMSCDQEVAHLVIEAADEDEAKRAAELVVEAEVDCPETWVTWVSNHSATGLPSEDGVHVVSIERIDGGAQVSADSIFAEAAY